MSTCDVEFELLTLNGITAPAVLVKHSVSSANDLSSVHKDDNDKALFSNEGITFVTVEEY